MNVVTNSIKHLMRREILEMGQRRRVTLKPCVIASGIVKCSYLGDN